MDDQILGSGGPAVQDDVWLLDPVGPVDPADHVDPVDPVDHVDHLYLSYDGCVNDRCGRLTKQSELYTNLAHCNKALKTLMLQNTALRNKISMAAASEGNDEVVTDMKEPLPWSAPKISFTPTRHNQESSSSSESSSAESAEEDEASRFSWVPSRKENYSLNRLADQEVAVCAYRNLLGELGGQIGTMEARMTWLQIQAERLRTAGAIQEQLHEHEALSAEIERLILLDDLKKQAIEAENMCQELRQQLDDSERQARRNKYRADARIAELNFVIESSHLDVQCLRNENEALREQLASQVQRFAEREHADISVSDFSSQ